MMHAERPGGVGRRREQQLLGLALLVASALVAYLPVTLNEEPSSWFVYLGLLTGIVVVSHLALHPWWPLPLVWLGFAVGAYVGIEAAIGSTEPLWLIAVVVYVGLGVVVSLAVNLAVLVVRPGYARATQNHGAGRGRP